MRYKTHNIYTRSSCLLLLTCICSNSPKPMSVIQELRTAGGLSAPADTAPCAPPAPGAQVKGLLFCPGSALPLHPRCPVGVLCAISGTEAGLGSRCTGGLPPTQTLGDRLAAACRASASSLLVVVTLKLSAVAQALPAPRPAFRVPMPGRSLDKHASSSVGYDRRFVFVWSVLSTIPLLKSTVLGSSR